MTPVASRIADREENRFVQFLSAMEGFLPPGIPINRIVGMLEEVGTCLLGETVGWTVPGPSRHRHSPYHPIRVAVNPGACRQLPEQGPKKKNRPADSI
jgi:hypothetical protein